MVYKNNSAPKQKTWLFVGLAVVVLLVVGAAVYVLAGREGAVAGEAVRSRNLPAFACKDYDVNSPNEYLVKGKVISDQYKNGKEDYCTLDKRSNIQVLMEGRCVQNQYQATLKNCAEISDSIALCKDGQCYNPCSINGPNNVNIGLEKVGLKKFGSNLGSELVKGDYLILTAGENTYTLQYKGADLKIIRFKNLDDGEIYEYAISKESVDKNTGIKKVTTIFLGGYEYPVYSTLNPSSDYPIIVYDQEGFYGCHNSFLLEGDTKTILFNQKTYEFTVIYISESEAKLTMGTYAIPKLKVGESHVLEDGTKVILDEIIYQSYAGGTHAVKVHLEN